MSYDAVLFDCDGVLAETPDRETMTDAMRRVQQRFDLSDPPEAVVADFVRGNLSAITERCRAAGIERETFCAAAAREGVRAQLSEIRSGLRSLYDDVVAVRRLDRPRGVVSDNHPHVLSVLVRRFDLTDCFETVHGCRFTPSGLERRKPDPHNVEAAIDDLDTETALYVGDRPVDVAAADNAGIDSALLRRDSRPGSGPGVAPTYELSTLRELPEVL